MGLLGSRNILGIDLGNGELRVVQVALTRAGPVLQRWAAAPLPAQAPAAEAAETLRVLLSEKGFAATSAALVLPAGSGFVQAGDPADKLPAGETFLRDSQSVSLAGRDVPVTASAARRQVLRAHDIARLAGLSVQAVQLPQHAAAAAAGLLDRGLTGPVAGLVFEPDRLLLAAGQGQTLLTAQTSRIDPDDALNRYTALADQAARMVRLLQLGGEALHPGEVRVVADRADDSAVQALGRRLGLPVERVWPGESAGLRPAGEWPERVAPYAVALGAALMGLGLAGRRTEFRQAPANGQQTSPALTLRVVGAVVGGVVLALVLGLGAWVLHQRAELQALQVRYEAQRPRLERHRQTQQAWATLGPWLDRPSGGARLEYLAIVDTLKDRFPDGDSAYVTRLVVDGRDEKRGIVVSLTGQAADSEVLYTVTPELNRSGLLADAQLGEVLDSESNPRYPKHFVMTMRVQREPSP